MKEQMPKSMLIKFSDDKKLEIPFTNVEYVPTFGGFKLTADILISEEFIKLCDEKYIKFIY